MLLFHLISKQDHSYHVQYMHDFKQLGQGLRRDCYLDVIQSYGLGHCFEFTTPHLGQNIAHT